MLALYERQLPHKQKHCTPAPASEMREKWCSLLITFLWTLESQNSLEFQKQFQENRSWGRRMFTTCVCGTADGAEVGLSWPQHGPPHPILQPSPPVPIHLPGLLPTAPITLPQDAVQLTHHRSVEPVAQDSHCLLGSVFLCLTPSHNPNRILQLTAQISPGPVPTDTFSKLKNDVGGAT